MSIQVPNPSHIPCIFKDLVHIWSGRGYKNRKPLIILFIRGFWFDKVAPKFKTVYFQVVLVLLLGGLKLEIVYLFLNKIF